MQVIENAWGEICKFEKLLEADRNARKSKRYRPEIMAFTAHLEDNLFAIQRGMVTGEYELGPYRKLWVYVPKKRLVMALDYPDRIVQWSLYQYLNPVFDKLFIEDSYACRKGKGSHRAAKRLQYWMRQVNRKPGGEKRRRRQAVSHLQVIMELESTVEVQARAIKVLATRLAELGDTETGRDEIARADELYRKAIGGDELPDWPDGL